MIFINSDVQLSSHDIVGVENETGVKLPESLRRHYLRWNGGEPEPYVFENQCLDTVVSEFFPLMSHSERDTAVSVYRRLILEKALAPRTFFPFAVDGGGDYFFADCGTPEAMVYFFRGDYWSSDRSKCLLGLSMGFDEFLSRLKTEA
jgi:hypothetical protein